MSGIKGGNFRQHAHLVQFFYYREIHQSQVEDKLENSAIFYMPTLLNYINVIHLIRYLFQPMTQNDLLLLSHKLVKSCRYRTVQLTVMQAIFSVLCNATADIPTMRRYYLLRIFPVIHLRDTNASINAIGAYGRIPQGKWISPPQLARQCITVLLHIANSWPKLYNHFMCFSKIMSPSVRLKYPLKNDGHGRTFTSPLNCLFLLLFQRTINKSNSLTEALLNLIVINLKIVEDLLKGSITDEFMKLDRHTLPQLMPHHLGTWRPSFDCLKCTGTCGIFFSSKCGTLFENKFLFGQSFAEYGIKSVIKLVVMQRCSLSVLKKVLIITKRLSLFPCCLMDVVRLLKNHIKIAFKFAVTSLDILAVSLFVGEPLVTLKNAIKFKALDTLTAHEILLKSLFILSQFLNRKEHVKGVNFKSGSELQLRLPKLKDFVFYSLLVKLDICLQAARYRKDSINCMGVLLPLIEAIFLFKEHRPKYLDLFQGNYFGKSIFQSHIAQKYRLLFKNNRNHLKLVYGQSTNRKLYPQNILGWTEHLDSRCKLDIFYSEIKRHLGYSLKVPILHVWVRRDKVFYDSFKCLYFRSLNELQQGRLSVHFQDEEGIDLGGVTREWFQMLIKQISNGKFAFFLPSGNKNVLHPSSYVPDSGHPERLSYYRFIGRVVGKAIIERHVLGCRFSQAVYKQILNIPINFCDLRQIDPQCYESLSWILKNDISGILDETFTVKLKAGNLCTFVDLKKHGRDIHVTEANKVEYVKLLTQYKLLGDANEYMNQFLHGLREMIPAHFMRIFTIKELEQLISGSSKIDLDDWEKHTVYYAYTYTSPQIRWFWKAVRSFTEYERTMLLQFVTGARTLPPHGFSELPGPRGATTFKIRKDCGPIDRLPSSHTCINRTFT